MEVTVGIDGRNEVGIIGTEEGNSWSRPFERMIFDGRRLPSVSAWVDLGGEAGKGLHIGPITMRLQGGMVEKRVSP